jgi:hypothetical protein
MKRQSKKTEQAVAEFPVWTHEQASRAVPYVAAVMQSIRDLYVRAQGLRHRIRKVDAKPGRPDRHAIIQHETAKLEAERLQEEVVEAAKELAHLNIHCVDPVNGIAMIPFVQQEQLAWLVFNLFDDVKISAWRFHHDPMTVRRPLPEIDTSPMPEVIIV